MTTTGFGHIHSVSYNEKFLRIFCMLLATERLSFTVLKYLMNIGKIR